MISICGDNSHNQLSKISNNKNAQGKYFIDPPLKLPIDPSLIKSYSICFSNSIIITCRNTIYGIGNNMHYSISTSLPRQIITDFTEFKIRDADNLIMKPISVLCCGIFSIFIVLSSADDLPQLVIEFENNNGRPLFLDLNGRYPVSLYNGEPHIAGVIDNKNEIILIKYANQTSSSEMSFSVPNRSYSLPFNEKAVSLAFCACRVYALSSTGKVYCSYVNNYATKLEFASVVKLNGITINSISGVLLSCYAVSNDGRVFAFGGVENCIQELEENEDFDTGNFYEMTRFKGLKIKNVFDGYDHSFFITEDGKVLACGSNLAGQLNIDSSISDSIYLPFETRIKHGCTFCIAGCCCSAFFIDCNPPRFVPNQKIGIVREDENLFSDQSDLGSLNALSTDEIESFDEKTLIGKGGQSHVYQVVKEGKKYALKEIDVSSSSLLLFEHMNNLIYEYELIIKLNHPNIIKAFGFCFGNPVIPPSILLEFCPYNLFSFVKKLSNMQKITAIYEIVSAMIEIHKNKIIHRDLKPENILFDEEMHVKISDFGIAKLYNATNSTKTTGIGTLKFMAPEILNGSTKYSEKVDVYSFGVLLFFILTNGKYPKINIAGMASGKIAPIPEIINFFSQDLIIKCWSLNPDERPSFTEIADEIKKNNFGLIYEIEDEIANIKEFLSI